MLRMMPITLPDAQWNKIYQFRLDCSNIFVRNEVATRRFVEAILRVTRNGAQWRLLPTPHARLLCSATLRKHLRREAFFNCWTRKDAYIKAKGKGLTLPLDAFDVSLTPGELAAQLYTQEHPQEISFWFLQTLNPEPGYAATLAEKGHNWKLKCWQWSPAI